MTEKNYSMFQTFDSLLEHIKTNPEEFKEHRIWAFDLPGDKKEFSILGKNDTELALESNQKDYQNLYEVILQEQPRNFYVDIDMYEDNPLYDENIS